MAGKNDEGTFDRERFGRTVREFRLQQDLTQAKVAQRAGVSITTVYKVEAGAPVRNALLRKVCEVGLDARVEALLRHRTKAETQPCLVHHAEDGRWEADKDRRTRRPEDDDIRLQDPAERRRLGALGFVDCFFLNPRLIMPEGPGTLFFELHARSEGPINELIFRNCKVYVLSGGVRLGIADEVIELGAGGMVGCGTADIRWIEPLEPLGSEPAPVILWIGAGRIDQRLPSGGRPRLRGSKR